MKLEQRHLKNIRCFEDITLDFAPPMELASWPPEDRRADLSEEIEQTRWEPYATTMKHFLQNPAS